MAHMSFQYHKKKVKPSSLGGLVPDWTSNTIELYNDNSAIFDDNFFNAPTSDYPLSSCSVSCASSSVMEDVDEFSRDSSSAMDVDEAAQSAEEKDNVELAVKFGGWDSAKTTQDPVKLVQPEGIQIFFFFIMVS